jgi:acetyl esterase/lipase
MIYEKIQLNKHYESLKTDPILTSYCPDNSLEIEKDRLRKCVLVLPGGGYEFVSDRENEAVALRFVGYDIACFTLKYTTSPFNYPTPLVEVFAALSYIRKNYQYYHIDPNKISVLGFSAGGHLAGICSCYSENKEYADYLNITVEEMKINGCILSYPVISTDFGHKISIDNITQKRIDLMDKMSVDKNITSNFPKTFIWHTTFDNTVDVKNSLALALELSKHKVFYELHIYPMLDHGQSLSDRSVYGEYMTEENINKMKHNTQWVDNAIHFVKEYI